MQQNVLLLVTPARPFKIPGHATGTSYTRGFRPVVFVDFDYWTRGYRYLSRSRDVPPPRLPYVRLQHDRIGVRHYRRRLRRCQHRPPAPVRRLNGRGTTRGPGKKLALGGRGEGDRKNLFAPARAGVQILFIFFFSSARCVR